jgi:ribosomal protein L34
MKRRYTPEIPEQRDGYIFRSWIATKDGRRIYARDFGLKAFRIQVRH